MSRTGTAINGGIGALSSANVQCNAGDVATGGGANLNSEATTTKVGDSRPANASGGVPTVGASATGWYAEVTSTQSGAQGTFDVWVVCMHVE